MKRKKTIFKKTVGEKVVYSIVSLLFFLYAVSLIYPFVYLFINSFQTSLGYFNNLIEGTPFKLPEVWQAENYVTALNGMTMVDSMGNFIYLPEMFLNSVWYTLTVVCLSVFASCLTGYCLAKYEFRFSRLLYGITIVTLTIPIIGSTGASFKLMSDLGIYNTPFYVIFTSFSGFGFNFLVLYGFFKNLSWSYAEAVFIDGGNHATVFFRVMLPQASPFMLTLALIAFIGAWNDYMTPLLYIPDYPTVASGMYRIKLSFTRSGDMPSYFAGLLLTTIPVIVLFSAFSDKIMNNMTIGGLKG